MNRLVIGNIVFVLDKSLPIFWVVGVCPFSSSQACMYVNLMLPFSVTTTNLRAPKQTSGIGILEYSYTHLSYSPTQTKHKTYHKIDV